MTTEDFIKDNPQYFKDELDKWLYREFDILGGAQSSIESMKYHVAREVAEKAKIMTKEYAIQILQIYRNGGYCKDDNMRTEAVDMAIDALKSTEVSDDLEEAYKKYADDIDAMVEEYWNNEDRLISSHTRAMIEEAYRKGLEDMYKKLKGELV